MSKTDDAVISISAGGTKQRGRLRSLAGRHKRLVGGAIVLAIASAVFFVVWFQPQKLIIEQTVNEQAPAAQSSMDVLASGEFRTLEHGTTGTASILELADGQRVLRLDDLDTSNGPDLRVYLSKVEAVDDARAYREGFVDLGALKGNKGSQNYEVPADVDTEDFNSAVIWCRRFSVGFGVAPLDPR